MLKVECESCHAPYQVDERRIPKAGLKMRCPQCGHSFLVPHPTAETAPSVPPPNVPPPDFDDILGVKGMAAPPQGGSGIGSFATALDDLDLDLPAVSHDPPARKAPKPAAAAPPAPSFAPAEARPPSPSFVGFGMVEDDLPVPAGFGEIDMPSVKKAPPKAAPAAPRAAAP
ncbi:MAG TPA: zinc-ribbon domain-containing protein, partial [Polyangiaceae bacterium]|nr:zinc-ribbon domain-containing protein [Polyangiaceae bacterium]